MPNKTIEPEKIWTEFVGACEDIEDDADRGLAELKLPTANPQAAQVERAFLRGQANAAKSIRRSVVHPKYRNGGE